jgi:hypothetical protein
MNTSYIPIKRYAIETAQYDTIRLFNETGIEHIVKTIADGIFVAVPVEVDHESEPFFLVGEKIPNEVRKKPKGNYHNMPPESGFTFSNGDELAVKAKAPNYMINNVLEINTNGILGGASMAFKTFVALRFAYSICTGKPFMGHDVFYSGKVLIACGEGQGALSRRIKAIQIVEGDFNNNLYVLNEPIRIDNKADMTQLKHVIDELKPSLFIFDTFASLVSETDENSPSDTGRTLLLIKETCRNDFTSSLIIHHHGKDASKGLRGASNFTNDVDFAFSLERQEGSMITTLSCKKMKDGDNFSDIHMEAIPVELGLERQDGNQATSLVIKPADPNLVKKTKTKIKLGLNDDKALQALQKAIDIEGVPPPKTIIDYFDVTPENIPQKVVNSEKWRKLAYEYFSIDNTDPKNLLKAKEAALRRAKKKLLDAYLIGIHGNYAWLIH